MNIKFADTAALKLSQIPGPFLSAFESKLELFAAAPNGLSRNAPPAYPRNGGIHQCFIGNDRVKCFVQVLWVWEEVADGSNIIIIGLGLNETFDGAAV